MTNSSSSSVTGVRGYDALRRLVDLLARQAARDQMVSLAPVERRGASPPYIHRLGRGPVLALSTSTCS
jgi:hypothetical protein